MRPTAMRTLAPLGAVLLGACAATTTFNTTWRNPEAQPVVLAGKKVAALVMSKNDLRRRAAEDALARELTARGAQGISAYTIVPTEAARDQERAKTALEQAGVDGVVILRPMGRDKQVSYTPGYWRNAPYYRSFWGYYGYGWRSVYEPGYLRTDTIVNVETLVYSFRQDALMWAGLSQTTNPENADSFMHELAGAVANEMKKAGLLQ